MTASAMLSSIALWKAIRSPSAVANAIDWKMSSRGVATAMAIDVRADTIGLALATIHSENDETSASFDVSRRRSRFLGYSYDYLSVSCQMLDSISLIPPENDRSSNNKAPRTGRRKRKRALPLHAKRSFSGLVSDHDISSFIVSWPLQQDTGLMGASCGRTLWVMEQLLEEGDDENETDKRAGPPVAVNRPVCLWESIHRERPCEDAFGRSSVYARTSTKTLHLASEEQYHQDDSISAVGVWKDFCDHHWPASVIRGDEYGAFTNTKAVVYSSCSSKRGSSLLRKTPVAA